MSPPFGVGTGRAARVLMGIKWSLLRGGLRGSGQQRLQTSLALVFSVALGLFGLLVFTTLGRAFVAGDQIVVVVLPVLVIGIGLLAAAAGVETTIDVRNLATEPLTPHEFGTATLAAALVGPPALLAGLSGLGLALGFGRATWSAAAIVILVVVAWWATLLLASRTAAALLGVLATGRFRQIAQTLAALASLAVWFTAQFSAQQLSQWDRSRWAVLAARFDWMPPAQLGRALADASARPGPALVHLLYGVAWLPVLWWLHTVAIGRLALAPPRPGADARRIRTGAEGLRAGVFRSAPVSPSWAIAVRTMRTKVRTPREAVNTIVAFVVGVGALALGPVLDGDPDGRIVLAAGLLHFAVLFEGNNTFGFDGPPLWMEVAAGADGRILARGKAIASVLTMTVPALLLVVVLAAISDGWEWVPAGLLLALGSVLLASGTSVASATIGPFAVPDSPNPFAAGDTGQGCLAGGILAADMIVLAAISAPIALAVWWGSSRSPVTTALVALVAPCIGVAVLVGGVLLAGKLTQRNEHELVAKVTPAR
ncbi:MAG: hypothetical protein ACKOYM_10890 [Actinomycetes bacterium]